MQVTLLGRVVLPAMVFFFTTAGLFQIPFVQKTAGTTPWFALAGVLIVSAAVTWLIWSFTEWDGDRPDAGMCATVGAFTMGFIGFYAGFVGPLVFMPDSNQGPLIGILFTGPLGAGLGALIGYAYWKLWGRDAEDQTGEAEWEEKSPQP